MCEQWFLPKCYALRQEDEEQASEIQWSREEQEYLYCEQLCWINMKKMSRSFSLLNYWWLGCEDLQDSDRGSWTRESSSIIIMYYAHQASKAAQAEVWRERRFWVPGFAMKISPEKQRWQRLSLSYLMRAWMTPPNLSSFSRIFVWKTLKQPISKIWLLVSKDIFLQSSLNSVLSEPGGNHSKRLD